MFWDALVLLSLSVYELCVRLDESWGWARAYFASHAEAGTRLSIILKHIPYANVAVWFYMLLCAALALWALLSRRTRRVSAFMLAPCAALTVWGFTLRLSLLGKLVRVLKLLPLVFMLLLCLAHLLVRPASKHAAPPQPQHLPQPAPMQQLPVVRHRRSERRRAS